MPIKTSARRNHVLWLSVLLALAACNLPEKGLAPASPVAPAPMPLFTASPSPSPTRFPATATLEPTETSTVIPTFTPTLLSLTPSASPTVSSTPTVSPSPSPSLTPTFDFPEVTVKVQANCRYGPGTAYLYAHGLYPGDKGEVRGRNFNSTWLYIKPENITYFCWVSISVVEVHGDISTVRVAPTKLPKSTLYRAPTSVRAVREGEKVIVSWKRVKMTVDDDRGYLLEVYVCQNGALMWMAVHTDHTSYEFTDQPGCKNPSSGLLYTVEKHGYSDPVKIPWPER